MGAMSPERVRVIVVGMITFILSVAVHEFGHAYVADRFGDRLPRAQGRVTLNPLAHADPLGTLLLPFILLATTGNLGFAWGKPVMHTTHDRKRRLFISIAGPSMNVVLALLVSLVTVALIRAGVIPTVTGDLSFKSTHITDLLALVVFLNFILFFFNLIPANPLDGGSVVRGLIPEGWVDAWDEYARYGPFVLLAILMIPQVQVVFWRPALFCTAWAFNTFGSLFGLPHMFP
ncbi:MAG TPA: site-2 protease family protein [Kofleriaceae bacterium]|nr:site-2 protease family protein [Kofleriaceae bacterium]